MHRSVSFHLLLVGVALISCYSEVPLSQEEDDEKTALLGPCTVIGGPIHLPEIIAESSGVVIGSHGAGVVWTHNDSGGEPVLFAVDTTGALRASVVLDGGTNVDWEDMAKGPCPQGVCFYVGDIGDNLEARSEIAVYRMAEPAIDNATVTAERFRMRYPDGPRDAESLTVLPDGEVLILTKGRAGPIEVFRYPLPLDATTVVELEYVRELRPQPSFFPYYVTGAAVSPDGRYLAVRTYVSLQFFRIDDDSWHPLLDEPGFSLLSLQEPQGEAVAMGPDGLLVLTSEASAGGPGPMWRLRCDLP